MATAHDLAAAAAAFFARIPWDDIERIMASSDPERGVADVTIWLTNGDKRSYTVHEKKEADTPNGESGPSSP